MSRPGGTKNECVRGHALIGDNVIVVGRGSRRCRYCVENGLYKHGGGAGRVSECPRGHDTSTADARYSGGTCKQCHRDKANAAYRAKRLGKPKPEPRKLDRNRVERDQSKPQSLALRRAEWLERLHDYTPLEGHWDLPWDIDDRAWYVVACHPGGLTLDEVGRLLGLTRERVRQIEEKALRKLRHRYPGQDWSEIIESLRDLEDWRAVREQEPANCTAKPLRVVA